MDPNAAVQRILDGLQNLPAHGGFEDASELDDAIEDLLGWLESDGFAPEEHDDACSLVVALYWHYTEWHAGMHSREYSILSRLGCIYTPGCGECGPVEWTPEGDLYEAANLLRKGAES